MLTFLTAPHLLEPLTPSQHTNLYLEPPTWTRTPARDPRPFPFEPLLQFLLELLPAPEFQPHLKPYCKPYLNSPPGSQPESPRKPRLERTLFQSKCRFPSQEFLTCTPT